MPPPAAAAPAPAPHASSPPQPQQEASDETALGVLVIDDEPLPFKSGPPDATRAKLANSVADATHAGRGHTVFVPAILSDGNQTLPFLNLSPQALDDDIRDRFGIEQYASLCAELAVVPDRRPHTLERYGIGEEALDRLTDAWNAEVRNAPEKKTRV